MHMEVLVEDQSGAVAIEVLLKKILLPSRPETTYRIHPYKGLGRIPSGLKPTSDARHRILLDQLPRLLRGYGKSLPKNSAVIVVVDRDRRDCMEFKRELIVLWKACRPRPQTLFRIAIEELEAWFLGDAQAVHAAYPQAPLKALEAIENPDAIIGAWEKMADLVYSGGANALKKQGYPIIGQAKAKWAEAIASHMNVEANRSRSFQVFRDGVRRLVDRLNP
jgi:hypothetical protein